MESVGERDGQDAMKTITTIILFVLLGGSNPPSGSSVICCHYAEDGNLVCKLPVDNSCAPGDKAVVCRNGIWEDPGGYAECIPN